MTRYDTPGYYTVVDNPNAITTIDDYIEGRIFLNEETLVCGAGEVEGYGSTVDEYSGSSIRVLFGKKYDPQQFGYEAAQTRDETITASINAITDVKLIKWEKNESSTSRETYGVILSIPSVLNDDLVIQLGKGTQNRGVGKKRHIAFANALAERCTTKESKTVSSDTTSESEIESATTTQSDNSSKSEITTSTSTSKEVNSTDQPTAQEEWIEAPDTTESSFEVANHTNRTQTCKITFRADGKSISSITTSIEPNKSAEINRPSERKFQIGIAIDEETKQTTEIDKKAGEKTIQAIITDTGIHFTERETDSEPQSNEESADDIQTEPTSSETDSEIKPDESTANSKSHEEQQLPGDKTERQNPAGKKSLIPLFTAVCAVIAIPLSGFMPASNQLANVVIAGLPSLITGFLVFVIASGEFIGATDLQIIVMIILGVAIPITLLIDIRHMRRNTDWNPNWILYLFGAILIWPVTLLLYLARRTTVPNQSKN